MTKAQLIEALKDVDEDEPIMVVDYIGVMPIVSVRQVSIDRNGFFTRNGHSRALVLLDPSTEDMPNR